MQRASLCAQPSPAAALVCVPGCSRRDTMAAAPRPSGAPPHTCKRHWDDRRASFCVTPAVDKSLELPLAFTSPTGCFYGVALGT